MTFLGLCPCPSVHMYSRGWAADCREPVPGSPPLSPSCSRPLQPSPVHSSSRSFSSPRRPRPAPSSPLRTPSPSETPPHSALSFSSCPEVSSYTSPTSRDEGSLSATVRHKLQDTTQGTSEPYRALKGSRRPCPGGGRARAVSRPRLQTGHPAACRSQGARFQAMPRSGSALRRARVHTDVSPRVIGALPFTDLPSSHVLSPGEWPCLPDPTPKQPQRASPNAEKILL